MIIDSKTYDAAIIVSVVPDRLELLQRSVYTWKRSIEASGLSVAICLYLEDAITSGGDFNYPFPVSASLPEYPDLYIVCVEGKSGSHIKGYNYWLDRIDASVYIFTHPEMLFPETAVSAAVKAALPHKYVSFKVLWMPEYVVKDMDAYPWREPELLEKCDEMYRLDEKLKGQFYWNTNVRENRLWETTASWAMEKHTLSKLRPFPDFGIWGPDDVYFLQARQRLCINTHTLEDPIVFHQYHNRPPSQNEAESREYFDMVCRVALQEIKRRYG